MRNLNNPEGVENGSNEEAKEARGGGQDDSPSIDQSDLNDIENEGVIDLNMVDDQQENLHDDEREE